MQYNGGKKRIAKYIAAIINQLQPKTYWEPFCGMCSVGLQVKANQYSFSDVDPATIAVLKAARDGFEFPGVVTEDEYRRARLLPPDDPLHGFCKFGCSFAGKPWGGYARNAKGDNYALKAKLSLQRMDLANVENVSFIHGQYTELDIKADVIYCDPPYNNTTQCGIGGKFNSAQFWSWALAQDGIVFVSEYEAPDGFTCIYSTEIKGGLRVSHKAKNVEKLFVRNIDLQKIAHINFNTF